MHKPVGLADTGCQRSTADPHFRKWANAEDQQRVEDNIDHTAASKADHRCFHTTHGLKDLFKRQFCCVDHRKAKDDNTILHTISDDCFVGSKHIQEWPHKENAENHEQ